MKERLIKIAVRGIAESLDFIEGSMVRGIALENVLWYCSIIERQTPGADSWNWRV